MTIERLLQAALNPTLEAKLPIQAAFVCFITRLFGYFMVFCKSRNLQRGTHLVEGVLESFAGDASPVFMSEHLSAEESQCQNPSIGGSIGLMERAERKEIGVLMRLSQQRTTGEADDSS